MKKRLLIYFTLSGLASVWLLRDNFSQLSNAISYDYIIGQHNAAPWGVLTLCILWIVLKRKEIATKMELNNNPLFFAAGAVLMLTAFCVPNAINYLVIKLFLTWLGFFVMMFGRGAVIPGILFAAYAFTIVFPLLVNKFADAPYAMGSVIPATWLANLVGIPVNNTGQILSFPNPTGETISVLVSSACAGPATMAVFIAIFTLMMLDVQIERSRAVPLLLFGIAGTWLQNIIRIVIIAASGHLAGKDALWDAHFWTIYVLFPLWYLAFVTVYFLVAGKHSRRAVGHPPSG